MKILLITVAGLSSRFSSSVGYPCVKCLYYRNSFEESLLCRMIQRHHYFDRIVIVGGYKYELLHEMIKKKFGDIYNKILMVKNEKYADYGSGYSLYKGIQALRDTDYEELVFSEGDLFLDDSTFETVCQCQHSVITYNREIITADKSVAFYFDTSHKPHYIFDTSHGVLRIKEDFTAVYNSGQVWKFKERRLLEEVYGHMAFEDKCGTNLVPIESYFQQLDSEQYELIGFKKWINCNTVDDFKRSLEE